MWHYTKLDIRDVNNELYGKIETLKCNQNISRLMAESPMRIGGLVNIEAVAKQFLTELHHEVKKLSPIYEANLRKGRIKLEKGSNGFFLSCPLKIGLFNGVNLFTLQIRFKGGKTESIGAFTWIANDRCILSNFSPRINSLQSKHFFHNGRVSVNTNIITTFSEI